MEKELIYKRQKIYKYDKYGNKNIEYCKVFDQDDKPLLSTKFDKKGFVIANNIWDYFQENKVLEYYGTQDGWGGFIFCNIDTFDKNGNLVEQEYRNGFDDTGLNPNYRYNRIKKFFYNYNNNIIQEYVLAYQDNRKIGEYYINHHYDKDKNCILIEEFHIFDPPFSPKRIECFYDENNQKIKEIIKKHRTYEDDFPEIITTEFFYNLDGALVRKTIRENLSPQRIYENIFQEYCYDDRGNIISETFSGGDKPYPKITIYKYTYDDKGNIIEKKHYNETGLYEIEKHTFDEENKPQESFYYDKKGKLKSLHQWEYVYEGDE